MYYSRKNLCSSLSNEPFVPTKSQNTSKKAQCPMQKASLKHEMTEITGFSNKSSNMEVSICPKSTNTTKQENTACNNIVFNEKLKTPVRTKHTSGLFNDKTSVVQFCTPKHLKTTNTPHTTTKFSILPATRTPVKRYFNDQVLSQSTPDCFNTVHMETPCTKIDDIVIAEQTMYEGENSNLTVGIRIRPLNSK